jgi:hypothetical protein
MLSPLPEGVNATTGVAFPFDIMGEGLRRVWKVVISLWNRRRGVR